jgi:hypothetical protein
VRRLLILTVRSIQEFGDDRCTHMAAAISYYALFSLFPLLIFMVSIFGIFLQSSSLQEDLIKHVLDFIPLTSDKGRNEVKDAIGAIAGISIPLSIVGLLGLAWSASALFGAIRTSLNIAWDIETSRHFVVQKLLDLGMVAGVGVFFLLSIGTTALLRSTQEASSDVLGPLSNNTAVFWRTIPYLRTQCPHQDRRCLAGGTDSHHLLRDSQEWLQLLSGELRALRCDLRLPGSGGGPAVLDVPQRGGAPVRCGSGVRVPTGEVRQVRRPLGPKLAPGRRAREAGRALAEDTPQDSRQATRASLAPEPRP